MKKFRNAEARYKRLREQHRKGEIDTRTFNSRLKKLRLVGWDNKYWMIGAGSGKWYVYDKDRWIAEDPYFKFADHVSAQKDIAAGMPLISQRQRTVLGISVISLLIANLFPLAGVLFLGWKVSTILFLYWSENVVIGVWNLAKMKRAEGIGVKSNFKVNDVPAANVSRLGLMLFFLAHYGIFTLVHGAFVLAMFGGPGVNFIWILASFAFLFISHGISFSRNFINSGEFRNVSYQDLFIQPYARVVILHITIILGGFWAKSSGAPILALLLLVLLKTIIDLISHLRERKKFLSQPF